MNVAEAYSKIESELIKIQKDSGKENGVSPLVVTKDLVMADFVSYLSFTLFPNDKKEAEEKNKALALVLKEILSDIVTDVKPVQGFLNFFLKDEVIREENSKEKPEITTIYTGKNILVEHSSPNLFKPFSVGHLMNNVIGEFVTRAVKAGGADVRTMSFPSDVSLGIAKALMMIERDIKENKITLDFFKNEREDNVIAYLGEAYVNGVKECEEHVESLEEAKKVLDKMYNLKDDDFYLLVSETRKVNESYFKKILSEIGSDIKSHGFVYESWAGKEGEVLVKKNTGEGKVFAESEGAVVYVPEESRKDLHTAVFVNSQGYPTYEAKDLGLLYIKLKPFMPEFAEGFFPDLSFFITDAEQISHFKIVLDAASKLGGDWPEWVRKSHHVTHGRMLFKGAKMSSRLGGVPLALDVIGVVEEEVKERAGEKIAHLGDEERAKLTREIALSALRIAVLRSKPGININFDPETSLSFEGDSGPYLLYTHARCSSLVEKAEKEKGYQPKFGTVSVTHLERELALFPLIFKDAIETLSPQKLVTYLFKVAQGFNSFYGNTQILTDDKEISEHNLAIVARVKVVLKEGLHVLGIKAPERM